MRYVVCRGLRLRAAELDIADGDDLDPVCGLEGLDVVAGDRPAADDADAEGARRAGRGGPAGHGGHSFVIVVAAAWARVIAEPSAAPPPG